MPTVAPGSSLQIEIAPAATDLGESGSGTSFAGQAVIADLVGREAVVKQNAVLRFLFNAFASTSWYGLLARVNDAQFNTEFRATTPPGDLEAAAATTPGSGLSDLLIESNAAQRTALAASGLNPNIVGPLQSYLAGSDSHLNALSTDVGLAKRIGVNTAIMFTGIMPPGTAVATGEHKYIFEQVMQTATGILSSGGAMLLTNATNQHITPHNYAQLYSVAQVQAVPYLFTSLIPSGRYLNDIKADPKAATPFNVFMTVATSMAAIAIFHRPLLAKLANLPLNRLPDIRRAQLHDGMVGAVGKLNQLKGLVPGLSAGSMTWHGLENSEIVRAARTGLTQQQQNALTLSNAKALQNAEGLNLVRDAYDGLSGNDLVEAVDAFKLVVADKAFTELEIEHPSVASSASQAIDDFRRGLVNPRNSGVAGHLDLDPGDIGVTGADAAIRTAIRQQFGFTVDPGATLTSPEAIQAVIDDHVRSEFDGVIARMKQRGMVDKVGQAFMELAEMAGLRANSRLTTFTSEQLTMAAGAFRTLEEAGRVALGVDTNRRDAHIAPSSRRPNRTAAKQALTGVFVALGLVVAAMNYPSYVAIFGAVAETVFTALYLMRLGNDPNVNLTGMINSFCAMAGGTMITAAFLGGDWAYKAANGDSLIDDRGPIGVAVSCLLATFVKLTATQWIAYGISKAGNRMFGEKVTPESLRLSTSDSNIKKRLLVTALRTIEGSFDAADVAAASASGLSDAASTDDGGAGPGPATAAARMLAAPSRLTVPSNTSHESRISKVSSADEPGVAGHVRTEQAAGSLPITRRGLGGASSR